MDASTIIVIYTLGLAVSVLVTWLFTKISLGATVLPLTLYLTAIAYFFIQPQINDYGLDPANFYLFGILFILILLINGLMVYYFVRKARLEALMQKDKKDKTYRKEVWDKD